MKQDHHHGHRTLLWSLLIGLMPLTASAQEGEVRILVQPWKLTEFVLDGKDRKREVLGLRLSEGEHNFVFWAPNCEMWDTTLSVKANEKIELRKVLKRTPEFRAFEAQSKKVRSCKALLRYVPLAATVGLGAWVISNRSKHDEAYDELHQLSDAYATTNSPAVIAYDKQVNIPKAQQRLEETRGDLQRSGTIFGVAALATIYGFYRASKVKYPIYEDKEKVRFEGLVFVPDARGGMLMTGLTIPLR